MAAELLEATRVHYNSFFMLLAGDVGGTKTLLGLFDPSDGRPRAVDIRAFATPAFASFEDLLDAFTRELPRGTAVSAASFGVAGPVLGDSARLTNVPWTIARHDLAARLGTSSIGLLNDLEALGWSLDALAPEDLAILQDGEAALDGHAALIAAGTGLGQATLHRVDGRLVPMASEGGHADFAARTDRELELVRTLREQHGRAEVEQVLSGPGLINIHALTHRGGWCEMVEGVAPADAPARVSQAGLSGRCQGCVEALRMFASAYGAEAGNLALRSLATSGVYVGGGIAPRILPALRGGLFMDAFRDKAPMAHLLARIPVRVILNAEAGLLGAAVHAQARAEASPA